MKCIFSTKPQCDQFVERIDDPKGNVYDHQEKAHTYQNQADGKDSAQFFTDGTEDKVIFDYRYGFRRTLTQSHAKPPTGSNGKKRLHDLISFILIYSHRIFPRTDSLSDMTKKMISHDRSGTATSHTKEQIAGVPGGNVNHYQISCKKDHCTSKVSGQNQDAYMDSRNYGYLYYRPETGISGKKCSKEKYKSNFDGFGRLYSENRKLGTITGLCKEKYCCQKKDTNPGINPGKLTKKPHLSYHNRYHQRNGTGSCCDQKLSGGCRNIQTTENNESHT